MFAHSEHMSNRSLEYIKELLSSSHISRRNVLIAFSLLSIGVSSGYLPELVFGFGVATILSIFIASHVSAALYRQSVVNSGGYIDVDTDGYRTSFVFPSNNFYSSWGLFHSIILFDADYPFTCAALVEHEKGHIKTRGLIVGVVWGLWVLSIIGIAMLSLVAPPQLAIVGMVSIVVLFSGIRLYIRRVEEIVADMWAYAEYGRETYANQLESYVMWKVDSDKYKADVEQLTDSEVVSEFDKQYGRFREYPLMEKRMRLIRGERVWWMGIIERMYSVIGVSLTTTDETGN